jgi:hypothetical protein
VTARVSQRYDYEKSLFGGEGLLLFIVGQQNRNKPTNLAGNQQNSLQRLGDANPSEVNHYNGCEIRYNGYEGKIL